MTSRRKLEEEIARTTDPTVRKQLQELLDKRERRSAERISTTNRVAGEVIHELAEPAQVLFRWGVYALWGAVVGQVLVLIYIIISDW